MNPFFEEAGRVSLVWKKRRNLNRNQDETLSWMVAEKKKFLTFRPLDTVDGNWHSVELFFDTTEEDQFAVNSTRIENLIALVWCHQQQQTIQHI